MLVKKQQWIITHLLSNAMVLSAWVMSCDTLDNKSNSFVYLLVMLEMDAGENDPFLPLPCKKRIQDPSNGAIRQSHVVHLFHPGSFVIVEISEV